MEQYLNHKNELNRKRVRKHYHNNKNKKQRSSSSEGESVNFPQDNFQPPVIDDTIPDFDFKLANFDPQKPLYPNSDIKYGEFIKLFVSTLDQIHTSDHNKDELLKLLKAILPKYNQVPSSYYMLKNELKLSQLKLSKRQYVCVSCNKKVKKGELCQLLECIHFRNLKINQTRVDPYYITNDYMTHFKRLINKNWAKIIEYKSELNKNPLISDLCNANMYKTSQEITHNSIAIILFVDEAELTETSKDNNVYAILGLIMNLPLRVRSSYFNVLNFMFWGGFIVNFNNLFQFFEPLLEAFFNQEIVINQNLTVRVHLFGVIGDGPGRSKALNILQHNGFYSCFLCLQRGHREQGTNATKFKYDPTAKTRTHEIYLKQVETAINTKTTYQGIRDSTLFSKFVKFPMGEIIDPVHLIYEGTFKSLLQEWFHSSNNAQGFYLGSVQTQYLINNLIKEVKFPSDYPRLQRQIQKSSYFTANENKHFMLNVAIYIFEELLPEKYFDHFCLYVSFVRLLTKPMISNKDIQNASELVNEFVRTFASLYGDEKMTHNLHLHLHLPMQVFRFGSLDMVNVFPLEGYFKICRTMFHGSNAVGETINENMEIKKLLVYSEELDIDIENPRLLAICSRHEKQRFVKITKLLDPQLTDVNNIPTLDLPFILPKIYDTNVQMFIGTKALLCGICEINQTLNPLFDLFRLFETFYILSIHMLKWEWP